VSGIVPEFLNEDWREMRECLNAASEAAAAAADASTIEEVGQYAGVAMIALIDADFLRRRMERKTERDN
jgi:hypothetical protein